MGAKLDALMKDINKKAKEEIMTVGLPTYNYDRIPFTSPRMNYCTYGGLPIGKLVEFYGEEHGGKTTTALDVVANFQNLYPDKDVFYIDAENTLDVEWARKLGVDVDKMYILQPKEQGAEEIFQIILDGVESGECGLWVLDSIGALLSNQEVENTMEDKTYGGVSKPLTLFGKKVQGLNAKYHCLGIGINQEREKINSPYGGTTTPGGKAWKHFCSVRMRFARGSFIDEKGNKLTRGAETPAGNIVMMTMEKNKAGMSNRRIGEYTLRYETGIDYLFDLIDVAIRYDIIKKSGSWFDIVDIETGELLNDEKLQGQAKVTTYLDEHQDILQRVEQLVDNCFKE